MHTGNALTHPPTHTPSKQLPRRGNRLSLGQPPFFLHTALGATLYSYISTTLGRTRGVISPESPEPGYVLRPALAHADLASGAHQCPRASSYL